MKKQSFRKLKLAISAAMVAMMALSAVAQRKGEVVVSSTYQNPEQFAHPQFLADDVLYNFCGAKFSIGIWGNRYLCVDTFPEAGLTADISGNGTLYGTDAGPNPSLHAEYLDLYPNGTVFMMNSAGQVTTLHEFQPGEDGQVPAAALIQDSAGNLYGTTEFGPTFGAHNDSGSVFEIQAPIQAGSTYSVLYNFQGGSSDGANPVASLVQDSYGNLYGTTLDGGSYSAGTIFVLCNPNASGALAPCSPIPSSWTEHVIYNFQGGANDGAYPLAGLAIDAVGNFWGTTAGGGNTNVTYCLDPNGGNSCGTLFEISHASGVWAETPNPYLFCSASDCADGANPAANLLLNGSGNSLTMYSTSEFGGSSSNCFTISCGTAFAFSPFNNTVQTLYSFCQASGCADGSNPVAPLIGPDSNGNLYGTTAGGGSGTGGCAYGYYVYGCGTAFEILAPLQAGATEQVLYNFCTAANCTDGQTPLGGLVQESNFAHLYGTTYSGGTLLDGTVFELYTPCRYCLIINPNELSWQKIALGQIGKAQYVKVFNSSSQTVQIGSIEITGEFKLAKAKKGGCGSAIAPGATCLIGATFNPTQLGLQTGLITITDSAENSPQTVSLSGTGID